MSNTIAWRRALRCGASAAVLGAAVVALAPTVALAQAGAQSQAPDQAPVEPLPGGTISSSTETEGTDAALAEDGTEVDELVVTGVRRSLATAQDIKRDADTVVDSITATDIGAFPDKSVAEALQRVAGITVNRFAASDDTAHFSAEPSGVIVRGLPQVRSEFNGRDTFSANSSRGLSWGDVSPELMAGVDTYKNQTAELIEGGIAGTINLRTRVPFDAPGQLIALSVNLNYGDLSEKVTPEVSGIYSNRWMTSVGEFGFMANAAYSEVQTRSQGIQFGRMGIFEDVYSDGLNYIPSSVIYRDTLYDRTRNGLAFAGQWKDLDDRFLVTAQYNRSTYENVWHEYGVGSFPADLFYGQNPGFHHTNAQTAPQPAPGTAPFTFNDEGLFQTGVMTSDIGWWGANNDESALVAQNSSGMALVNACYGWNGCEPARRGSDFATITRFNHNNNMTEDGSVNFKWNVSDRLALNFDIQRVHSEVDNYDMSIDLNSFANAQMDFSGDHPKTTLLAPTNVNLDPGGTANPSNYYIRAIMDHIEESEGDQLALRADAAYLFETTWLDSLKVGVRRADRDQTVRWSAYNWQNVANIWTQNAAYFNVTRGPSGTFNGYPANFTEVREFGSNVLGGGHLTSGQFAFVNMDLIEDHGRLSDLMSASALGLTGGAGWDPVCSNVGDRAEEIPGTCFRQLEIADVSEETNAAYAMLKFGGPDARIGNFGISGNIGLRYVKTEDVSAGALSYARQFSGQELECRSTSDGDPTTPDPPVPQTVGCYLSDDEIAFNSGGGVQSVAESSHENWLPSFNLKVDLNETWLVRFAASRAMSRPDIGLLKNYIGISAGLPTTQNASDPRWVKNAAGEIVGVAPSYTATGFNPYLEPTTADQFDITLENYFSDVGSFTVALFYKKFNNYIQYGSVLLDVTNNGVTREVDLRLPVQGEGASIRGFEIAYQTFFDFLPEPFDGLGVQANYTYVENEGISNTNVRIVSSDGGSGTVNAGNPSLLNTGALEGLSEQAYNLVGMYEKGRWAARVAYNWRSEHLVTNFDCCVYLPVWQEDAGYLDASLRYRVNDNVEVSLQGSNLLNTETVLRQQVTDVEDGRLLMPNAWFQNDRRYVLGIRLKY